MTFRVSPRSPGSWKWNRHLLMLPAFHPCTVLWVLGSPVGILNCDIFPFSLFAHFPMSIFSPPFLWMWHLAPGVWLWSSTKSLLCRKKRQKVWSILWLATYWGQPLSWVLDPHVPPQPVKVVHSCTFLYTPEIPNSYFPFMLKYFFLWGR